LDSSKVTAYKVLQGKRRGTYFLYVMSQTAQTVSISIQFQSFTNSALFLQATAQLTLTTVPLQVAQLVLLSQSMLNDCPATSQQKIQWTPLDQFNNPVASLTTSQLGLSWAGKFYGQNLFGYIPNLIRTFFTTPSYDPVLSYDGKYVNLLIDCTKNDTLIISSTITLRSPGNLATLPSLQLQIVTSAPIAEHSQLLVS